MDFNAFVHDVEAWASAGQFNVPLLPLLVGVAGGYLTARWKGAQDHAQWLRGQRLEALTEFLQADGELGRLRDQAWRNNGPIDRRFLELIARFDKAGTKVELLCSAETNMRVVRLDSLWVNERLPKLVNGQHDKEALAIDDQLREAYLGVLRAARKELGVKGDPYPESFIRKMHPHLSPPSEVRATHGGDRTTTDDAPPS